MNDFKKLINDKKQLESIELMWDSYKSFGTHVDPRVKLRLKQELLNLIDWMVESEMHHQKESEKPPSRETIEASATFLLMGVFIDILHKVANEHGIPILVTKSEVN